MLEGEQFSLRGVKVIVIQWSLVVIVFQRMWAEWYIMCIVASMQISLFRYTYLWRRGTVSAGTVRLGSFSDWNRWNASQNNKGFTFAEHLHNICTSVQLNCCSERPWKSDYICNVFGIIELKRPWSFRSQSLMLSAVSKLALSLNTDLLIFYM